MVSTLKGCRSHRVNYTYNYNRNRYIWIQCPNFVYYNTSISWILYVCCIIIAILIVLICTVCAYFQLTSSIRFPSANNTHMPIYNYYSNAIRSCMHLLCVYIYMCVSSCKPRTLMQASEYVYIRIYTQQLQIVLIDTIINYRHISKK